MKTDSSADTITVKQPWYGASCSQKKDGGDGSVSFDMESVRETSSEKELMVYAQDSKQIRGWRAARRIGRVSSGTANLGTIG